MARAEFVFALGERHVGKVHFLSCFQLPLCRRVWPGADPFHVSSRHDATHHLAGAKVTRTNNTAPSSRPCANGMYELSDEHVFMKSRSCNSGTHDGAALCFHRVVERP